MRILLCLTLLTAGALAADNQLVSKPTNRVLEFCSPVAPAPTATRGALALSSVGTAMPWSDPATWGGTVPPAGSNVVIPAGMVVTLDTDQNVAGLTIDGTIEVARKNVVLTAGYILVRGTGKFIAGSEADPFAHNFTITLTGADRAATPMGGRVFGTMAGGRLELIGKAPSFSWTYLAAGATAEKGATSITLDRAPEWNVGDEIIITSTDFDYEQTEKRTITGINNATLTLDAPLSYLHFGVITQVNHGKAGVPTTIDERAEVALLTRYIKIQGAQGLPGIEDSETNGYGGHTMVMDAASVALVQGVEFYNMGQKGLLGRYPMHWHNVQDGGSNSFMRHCSTHRSFNRGTTIHKTNGVKLTSNVIFDTIGHGVFIEDGKETGNVFDGNLVALTRKSPMDVHWDVASSGARLIGTPANYWITNPNNTFVNNVAAGTVPGGFGFWYDLSPTPRPGSISADPTYAPNAQPFGVFKGNRSHSIGATFAFFFDGAWALYFDRLNNPAPVVIEDFTTFKVQNGQAWFTGGPSGVDSFTVLNSALTGDQILRNVSRFKNSLAVGRTANPVVKEENEHLRDFRLADYNTTIGTVAITGYDVVGRAEDSVFVNYRGVFPIRTDNDAGGFTVGTKFINANLVANSFNLSDEQVFKSQFTIEDPGDQFGNGAPGMFTYAELLTDSRSKTPAQGAKGMEATNGIGWWSQFLETDFAHVSFDRGSEPPYRVSIKPESKTKTFPFVYVGGWEQHSIFKLGELQTLTFSGPVENERIEINVIETRPEHAGKTILWRMPRSATVPTFTAYDPGAPITQATSLTAFNAATGITYFQDATHLYIKMAPADRTLRMAGYTISNEPPPPTGSQTDVDVATYQLAVTTSKTGIRTIVATITVKNRSGQNASGVTVGFVWSGIVAQSPTPVVTNRLGRASFTVKAKIPGIVTGTVTSLSGVHDDAIFAEPLSRSTLP